MILVLLLLVSALPVLAAEGNATEPDDRAVARWVIRMGGSVAVEGDRRRIWNITELPAGNFRLHTINLVGVYIEPADTERLSKLAHLKELHLSGRTWHSRPPNVVIDSLA